MKAEIGIIGGTGVYGYDFIEELETVYMDTPYGKPSDKIKIGNYGGKKIALLPRHGKEHTIPPHMINFRANIWALHKLGVKRIIATAAVGSLKEEYKPGDIVFVNQFIDMGKDVITFYDGPEVRHVSLADPLCPDINYLFMKSAESLGIAYHDKGTYIRVAGPRFSTRAESEMFRKYGDIIGMTAIPEAILSREKEICFGLIATITDYDVWADKPVDAQEVVKVMKQNSEKTEKIIKDVIIRIPFERKCICSNALESAGL
ncbi:MAG: S-methyl-5'-thioadenosine phosphorylase [Candidatus Aenigmarchaeota archaeon]|nr:S-methyl-5'-thioadenosine phosphorylase [Candidatus Aenigmarchaeota archaeon]